MERKNILGIFAIALFVVVGVSMVAAHGFGGFGFAQSDELSEIKEQHEAMQTAISEGDYVAWKSIMDKRIIEIQSKLTEDNFNVLRAKHQNMSEFRTAMQEAKESGDFLKVKALQEEYGFEGRGFGKEMKAGFKMGMKNCPSAN